MTKIFRIRRKSDGKFANAGEYLHFEKTGKLLVDEKGLLKHLDGYLGDFLRCKEDLEVVEYSVVETSTSPFEVWKKRVEEHRQEKSDKEEKRIAREQKRIFGETF